MLTERYARLNLTEALLPFGAYHPFPRPGDAAWQAVPTATREFWRAAADELLDYDWPSLRMGYYLAVKREGLTQPHWNAYTRRRTALGTLMVAECLTNAGKYLPQVIDGIYALCEETSWVQPLSLNGRGERLPTEDDNFADLMSGETAALLAFAVELLGARLNAVDPEICARIRREVVRRVLLPYVSRDDYWWMGYERTRINNWNPWCNHNIMLSAMLLDIDKALRRRVFERVLFSLDAYDAQYPADGACDEGPMYWDAAGATYGVCLLLLKEMSGGVLDALDAPKLRAIGAYICKAHIDGEYFVDFADGDAKVSLSPLVYRLGRALGDEQLTRFGALARPARPRMDSWFHPYATLASIFDCAAYAAASPQAPYVAQAYFEDCQIMVARAQAGRADGLYLAAKGGHNLESHNHNDVGGFLLYAHGQPIFIDLGTEEYCVKTFGPDRFSLWYLQSQYHNLPTVCGAMQRDGRAFCAREAKCSLEAQAARFSCDLAAAYPPEARLARWTRTCALDRTTGQATISDDWTLRAPGEVRYHFMTAREPRAEDGEIVLACAPDAEARMRYDASALSAEIEAIPLKDARLRRNWGDTIYRLTLCEREKRANAHRTFAVRLTSR